MWTNCVVACETVTSAMLQNTWQKVEYRLDICWATKGERVEICRRISKLENFLHLAVKLSFFIYVSLRNIQLITGRNCAAQCI
jgi:hypothetical protein